MTYGKPHLFKLEGTWYCVMQPSVFVGRGQRVQIAYIDLMYKLDKEMYAYEDSTS